MKLTLGTNIAAMKAQRQLSNGSNDLSAVFERLASGQRINRASDDAAGLVIADSLNADTRVYAQGVRNLNDGISVLNIADAALQELTNITFRLTELAGQAANGTLGAAQRASLDDEAQALKAEYLRIAKSTEFNGRKLFEGDYGALSLQAGYGTTGSISDGLGGAIGAGTFEEFGTDATSKQVNDLKFADLNNDGNIDLFFSSENDESITIQFGNGNGSFGAEVSYLVVTDPQSVIATDVNNDGYLDLLTASSADDEISLLLGDGTGSFASAVTISTNANPVGLAAADFNGDGNIDLVSANNGGQGVTVQLGNGDGTFSGVESYGASGGALQVSTGDINNDGIEDLLYISSGGIFVNTLLGNGDGTFQSEQAYNTGLVTPRNLQLADLNSDGILDGIVSDLSGGGFKILIGNGDGTFQSGDLYNVASNEFNTTIGDFNGDGILDFAGVTLGGTHIFSGDGDGTFTEVGTVGSASFLFHVSANDLNNDGVLDLVTYRSATAFNILLGETRDGVAPLLDFSLKTTADAKYALSRFEQKLSQLTTQRGQIGAFRSRVDVAKNVLSTSIENFKAAESRIRDADVAQEAANLVRLQILQQAASAVLGQANLQPQLVLKLLGKE